MFKKTNPVVLSLACAFGECVYILLVGEIMTNGQKLFGINPGVFAVVAFLLLFVVSAAISGALIFGRPILLYLDGRKKEGIVFFGYTLGWLTLILIALLVILRK